MKESEIRQVFKSQNFPFKATAFHKLITFIIKALALKTNISTTKALSEKIDSLKFDIDKKADSELLNDIIRRIEALEQKS